MKLSLLTSIAALSLLIHSMDVLAAPTSLGPLSQYVTPGDDGTWRVKDDGSSAFIQNEKSDGAVIYYYVNPEPGTEGSRAISVDVGLGKTNAQWSLAGLLYGYQENPKSYYAYTVGSDGSVSVHQMQNGNFNEIDRANINNFNADKTTLTIVEKGNQITIIANGQTVNSYTDNQLGKGAVGIVAGNIGQYTFSNFGITRASNSTGKAGLGRANVSQAQPNISPQSNPNTTTSNNAGATSNNNNNNNNNSSSSSSSSSSNSASSTAGTERKHYFPTTDPRFNGMVSGYIPFPASWKQLSGHPEFFFEGPNGIKVSNTFGQLFEYANNNDGLQMLQQMGSQNSPPLTIEQITEQFFMPFAREEKRTLVKTYPLPEYAQMMASFRARLFKSVQTQESTDAYALEWVDDKGLSYITALLIANSQAFPISSWFMQGQYLVAKTAHFEAAKDAFLYGITLTEIDPKWLQAANQRDAQKAGQSWAAHQSRMDAINARGKANQSVADIYSEISDISHAGYLKRSAMQSQGQSASVRATNDQSLISNQSTGERYVVDGLQNHHWVNGNGVHIATDNALFDPRTDETLKMFDWTQFQKSQ